MAKKKVKKVVAKKKAAPVKKVKVKPVKKVAKKTKPVEYENVTKHKSVLITSKGVKIDLLALTKAVGSISALRVATDGKIKVEVTSGGKGGSDEEE